MDFFTHLLIGIVLGRLLFKDSNKQKAIALGSILPDFDVFLAWVPSIFSSLFLFSHRGLFHSVITLLLFVPIIILILNYLMTKIIKLERFKQDFQIQITLATYFIAVLGSYLHLFMDMLNPQGVVVFSPLLVQRFTFSTMNFIEPAVSIPSTLIILYYGFKKYFSNKAINTKMFDRYSEAVGLVFVFFIFLNSFLLVQTVSIQDSNITTPGCLFTERWVVKDKNENYTVTLVNQLNQQNLREFNFQKEYFNASEISNSFKNQLLDNALHTAEYKKFLFTLDPESRTVINITKGIDPNQWNIKFIDIVGTAQQIYYNLPNSGFSHTSIIISITIG